MLFQISGLKVEVGVLHNGHAVEIGAEGTEIVPMKGAVNKLSLEVDLDDGLIPFKVIDREKNVRRLEHRGAARLVEVPIHTGYTADGLWVTYYPNNHFRVLDLNGSELRIWEIALVRQGARFYLTAQRVYAVGCFRGEGGGVVCPAFEQADHSWPQLIELLTQSYAGCELQRVPSDYVVPAIERPSITDKNVGWVQWYNQASGLGVIQTSQGPARVHWLGIIQPKTGDFASLEAGQMVRFSTLGPNGPSRQPSTIAFQAFGVSPIN